MAPANSAPRVRPCGRGVQVAPDARIARADFRTREREISARARNQPHTKWGEWGGEVLRASDNSLEKERTISQCGQNDDPKLERKGRHLSYAGMSTSTKSRHLSLGAPERSTLSRSAEVRRTPRPVARDFTCSRTDHPALRRGTLRICTTPRALANAAISPRSIRKAPQPFVASATSFARFPIYTEAIPPNN